MRETNEYRFTFYTLSSFVLNILLLSLSQGKNEKSGVTQFMKESNAVKSAAY